MRWPASVSRSDWLQLESKRRNIRVLVAGLCVLTADLLLRHVPSGNGRLPRRISKARAPVRMLSMSLQRRRPNLGPPEAKQLPRRYGGPFGRMALVVCFNIAHAWREAVLRIETDA